MTVTPSNGPPRNGILKDHHHNNMTLTNKEGWMSGRREAGPAQSTKRYIYTKHLTAYYTMEWYEILWCSWGPTQWSLPPCWLGGEWQGVGAIALSPCVLIRAFLAEQADSGIKQLANVRVPRPISADATPPLLTQAIRITCSRPFPCHSCPQLVIICHSNATLRRGTLG